MFDLQPTREQILSQFCLRIDMQVHGWQAAIGINTVPEFPRFVAFGTKPILDCASNAIRVAKPRTSIMDVNNELPISAKNSLRMLHKRATIFAALHHSKRSQFGACRLVCCNAHRDALISTRDPNPEAGGLHESDRSPRQCLVQSHSPMPLVRHPLAIAMPA